MLKEQDKQEILRYYDDGSKHSNYQNFPEFLAEGLGIRAEINEEWRGDTARLMFIRKYLNIELNDKVADIGANTGKFCMELAKEYTDAEFYAVEINKHHTDFISKVADLFEMKNLKILNKSAALEKLQELPSFDIALHMNVLHHVGVDFEQGVVNNPAEVKDYLIQYFKEFRKHAKKMVFQLGYNWGGNKQKPIVPVTEIFEMVKYQKEIFKITGWGIEAIGLYDHQEKMYNYISGTATEKELVQQIEICKMTLNSEFYKRPIFILTSNN